VNLTAPAHRRRPESKPARHPDVSHLASLEDLERAHVERVLAQSATFDEAAELLGINLTTLWRKRKRWGLG
jgi:two-component system, NtrC family, response regulator AlgB